MLGRRYEILCCRQNRLSASRTLKSVCPQSRIQEFRTILYDTTIFFLDKIDIHTIDKHLSLTCPLAAAADKIKNRIYNKHH